MKKKVSNKKIRSRFRMKIKTYSNGYSNRAQKIIRHCKCDKHISNSDVNFDVVQNDSLYETVVGNQDIELLVQNASAYALLNIFRL